MPGSLPKPVPFRMKPKKKMLSNQTRRAVVYLAALLTVFYIVFSTFGGDDTAQDYQLASPNEFVGIKKGKTTDYDEVETYVDTKGQEVKVTDESADGEVKKVYNKKNPHRGDIESGSGKKKPLVEELAPPSKKNPSIAVEDLIYKGPSNGKADSL